MEWKPLIRRAGSEIFKSSVAAVWFMFLTFPLMVIKISPLDRTIEWRWMRMVYVGVGAFLLSFIWRYMLERKETGSEKGEADSWQKRAGNRIRSDRMIFVPLLAVIGIFVLVFPFLFSSYQTSIMITALMYVMLGLGLNIVVGLAGLLDLGYVAFYAVGAYFYALMNHHFGLGFWVALPLAGALAATFGVLLGFPVLRLRGDYLAIVTLGFGEIIRLI
ncbi:MAG TPA: branched-chain amino acid ABC transporter permease, partial [Deltaproteobacteria bacterium]|nr:branched-chain amino acid ABC transporter permease [Deltaproteobacteria bacterium]HXK47748.1 branched-chain amino acid ABC transporter permease [Deltaproteobacteria bacterium]